MWFTQVTLLFKSDDIKDVKRSNSHKHYSEEFNVNLSNGNQKIEFYYFFGDSEVVSFRNNNIGNDVCCNCEEGSRTHCMLLLLSTNT